jgi:hypothetical protein
MMEIIRRRKKEGRKEYSLLSSLPPASPLE